MWFRPLLAVLGGMNVSQALSVGIIALVTVSTFAMQLVTYTQIYLEKNATVIPDLIQVAECDDIQKKHQATYEKMGHICGPAKDRLRIKPWYAAFIELVERTWPHTGQIHTALQSFAQSYAFNGYVLAAVIALYHPIRRYFSFCNDKYEKHKAKKLDKLQQQLFLASKAAQLQASAQREVTQTGSATMVSVPKDVLQS
jgi:putative transposon-encoded protein